jgi:hypothetical protein
LPEGTLTGSLSFENGASNKIYVTDEGSKMLQSHARALFLSSIIFALTIALTIHASYGGSGSSIDQTTIGSPTVKLVPGSSANVDIPVNNSRSTSNWVFLHLQSYSVNEANITIMPDPLLLLASVPAGSASYQALFTIHIAKNVHSGTYVADLSLSMRNSITPPFIVRLVSFSITIVVLNPSPTNYDLTFYAIFLSCSAAFEIVLMLYVVSRWMGG